MQVLCSDKCDVIYPPLFNRIILLVVPRDMVHFIRVAVGTLLAMFGNQPIAECGTFFTERSFAFSKSLPELGPECKRIYLLRHGETDWNKKGLVQGGGFDVPLNEKGLAQARYVAEELSCVPLGVVASSHLERASQTADAVKAGHPSAARLILNNFGEMRFGELEGAAIHGPEATDHMKNIFRETNDRMALDPSYRWPAGESAAEVEHRAREALSEVLNGHPDCRHVAVVAHGRTNKILLSSLLFGDATKIQPFKQGNTCINVLDFDQINKTWSKVLLNYVEHNEDRGAESGGRDVKQVKMFPM